MKKSSELVSTITDEDHLEFIKDNDYVVIDLWATWCSPCIQMDPIVEDLAERYDGKVNFGRTNIEENSELPSRYGIQSLPSFLFFKNGEHVDKERGVLKKDEFEKKLKENFEL